MNKSFPSNRLVRHRAKEAFGYLFSFSGVPMVVSGCLVVALALCTAYHAFDASGQSNISLWVAGPCVAFAVAYCIPWGIFERATPAEEAEATKPAEADRQ